MAYTIEQLTALEDAIAQGTLEVVYADKKVRYRSLDEMIRIRDLMKNELGLIDQSKYRRYGVFNKGLNDC